MIELKQFRLGAVAPQSNAFDFERASVALLARYKPNRATAASGVLAREWRDLLNFRGNATVQQGVQDHG